MDWTVITKVYYARKTGRIQEGAKIVNMHHALQIILRIFAFESVLQSSFEFFASINLLVFGCLFLVG